jgi:hypothetical protein
LIAGRDKNQPIDGCLHPIIIKAAIQKYQSFFGVCEVYATLIIIKDHNTKKKFILWGL